ncbi:MAG TPA: peptidoglycan editing factor PgeF [Vicinamibacterales bacterium]|nr:peptidoglycan editing factor PgeF [Vicinamibacterales bacterium]
MTLPRPDATFHWTSEVWGDALRCRALSARAQHLFTSRQLPLPDDGAWRAALSSVGSSPDRLMRVRQVHGNVVRILERGRVSATAHTERPDGDAIVSNEPGLALAVMVADCVPILLCDPVGGAAAAIHAGWRGTCARVVRAAIEAMKNTFGTDPEDLVAAIGPSVGPSDYQVGDSVVGAFLAAGHPQSDMDPWFRRQGDKIYLDLWAANIHQLIDAGVDAGDIFLCGLSTVSHPAIFDSYRVEGEKAGRMAGIIVVPTSAQG